MTQCTFQPNKKNLEKGFTIIELIVVIAIISLLAVVAVPAYRSIAISGKVGPTASDINKIAAKMSANFMGAGATPYTQLGAGSAATAVFANIAKDLGPSLQVSGTGATATIAHSLGASTGRVTVAQANIAANGDSFAVTLNQVSKAACPDLAASIGKAAERIQINTREVKAVGGTYDNAAASTSCTDGDTNTFTFTFR